MGIFWLILFGEVLYHILLVRTTKKKWQRGPSMPDDKNYMKLYTYGEAWRKAHLSSMRDVRTKSGRLTLAAEYYDFGSDKCAIVLPGRMETAWYCAFFAEPYEKAGWNGGSLERVLPGMCIGGDYFGNYEERLPKAKGRTWRECDINTLGKKSRGAERLLYSNDGLIYYTSDHYESFTQLY